MVFSADIRRFSGLLLALLMLAAVMGPACLMLPTSAMAIPVDGELVPCETEDPGTTVEACPFERPVSGPPTVALADGLSSVAFLTVADLPVLESSRAIKITDAITEDPPPAHLTPLRI